MATKWEKSIEFWTLALPSASCDTLEIAHFTAKMRSFFENKDTITQLKVRQRECHLEIKHVLGTLV